MKIDVTPTDFFGLIIIYLLDKMNNFDSVLPKIEDKDTNKLLKVLSGFKMVFYKYYFDTSLKNKYRKIRSVFLNNGDDDDIIIVIKKKSKINEKLQNNHYLDISKENTFNESIVVKIVNEVLKKIDKFKFYQARPITNDIIKKMVKKTIKEI